MKIYFAGSIRGGRDDRALYEKVITLLSQYGTVLTEHIGDKLLSPLGEDGLNETYIYNRDITWLKKADVFVAEITTPSLGVGYEIAKALEWNKQILCLFRYSKGKKVSAMIAGNKQLQLKKYKSIKDIPILLKNFFQNKSN